MTYFLILGNNPSLSIAEIHSLLSDKIIRTKESSDSFLIIESKEKLDIKKIQKELGGTIKIGEIKKNLISNNFNNFLNDILELLPKNLNKINFGFSFYGFKDEEVFKKRIKKTALLIKKQLKNKEISSRWIISLENQLSSVILKKNNVLEKGVEICFLKKNNKVFLGKTISCQEFRDYEKRDFGRPDRFIEKGMIPPKLAKMMINLGKETINGCFLDPFCGPGTFLQEAFLTGFKAVIGTDKNKEVIKKARKNMEWIAKKEDKSLKQVQVFYLDSRKLSKKIKPQSISLIATEPYLGPLNLKKKTPQYIIKELGSLYLDSFKEFKKIVKPSKKVVIIFPILNVNGKKYYIQILDLLRKIGWEKQDLSPYLLSQENKEKDKNRGSIVYSRPKQIVQREIFVFKSI